VIEAEHIERAERLLKTTYMIGVGDPRIIIDRARADRAAVDNLMIHHKTRLFKEYLPDVDPRVEPAIVTMFLHFFALGAISQRVSDGNES
jgi:hypothetical protein